MEKKIQNSPEGVTQEQTPLGAVVYENGVPSNEKAYAKGARKIEADREANGDAGTAPNDQLTKDINKEPEALSEADQTTQEGADKSDTNNEAKKETARKGAKK